MLKIYSSRIALKFAVAAGLLGAHFVSYAETHSVVWAGASSEFTQAVETAYGVQYIGSGNNFSTTLSNYADLDVTLNVTAAQFSAFSGPDYNQGWGGITGPQLYFQHSGTDAGTSMTFELSFSGTPGGYATNVVLPFLAVNGKQTNPAPPPPVWSTDNFTISATGPGGGITLDTSWVSPASTSYFTIAQVGSDLDVDGTLVDVDDHTESQTNFTLSSPPGVQIETLTIVYDPLIGGTGRGESSGFSIGGLSFDTIPEPGIGVLISLTPLIPLVRRRRCDIRNSS